ncbi:YhcN/YlaJ family sporulation lipoprotein [Paenibacillus pasadenensis]|uniref:YhcN/YlaJ family sporulation lipoprotein n=1 Tax=Paenibacillus pasadenensis TaxID=217090 RepID=UPI00203AAA69|nr:YhcN/YlaJ family sporulation lipoprotein [Paenibacillus pasadenensis]MCM3746906.1 YhcN/YlaJ family sporulation lipoprotein [Paenibacillus pasadenensis]
MKHPWKVLAASVVLTTALAGCGANHGELGNKNIRNNNVGNYRLLDKRFADDNMNEMHRKNGTQLNGNNIIGNHKNYRLQSDGHIATSIKKIPGVRDAYVMTTNDNAYVAVGLKGNSIVESTRSGMSASDTGRMGVGNSSMKSRTYNRMDSGVNRLEADMNRGVNRLETGVERGLNRAGNTVERGMNRVGEGVNKGLKSLERGMNDMLDNGMADRSNNNGYKSYSNGYNSYGTSDATNNRGKLENGLSDNNNIYMDRELNSQFKAQVADVVRKAMPGVDKVFVSSNPEFVSRMQGYHNDANQGNSIQTYMAEFNAMVDRIFPNVDDGSNGMAKKLSGRDAHIFK